jgi:hypothetical protein
MSRRSLALGALFGGSLLALTVGWTQPRVGQDLTQALGLVALVGTVLILVLRVPGRRVLGLLLGVLGLGMALAGAMLAGSATALRVAYAVGGALVMSGGLLTMITGARSTAPADRFSQDQTSPHPGTDDPLTMWQAMDAGMDPTADPDVRKADPGDTMRSANQSQQSSRRK